jgi:hypothetical protein
LAGRHEHYTTAKVLLDKVRKQSKHEDQLVIYFPNRFVYASIHLHIHPPIHPPDFEIMNGHTEPLNLMASPLAEEAVIALSSTK